MLAEAWVVGCIDMPCALQVAAYANNHLCVRKAQDSEGRVHTTISHLEDDSEIAQEIAAMLGESSLLGRTHIIIYSVPYNVCRTADCCCKGTVCGQVAARISS